MKSFLKILIIAFLISASSATLGFAQSSSDADPFFQDLSKKEEALVETVYDCGRIRLDDGRKIKLIGLKAIEAPKRKKIQTDKNGFVIEEIDPMLPLDQQAYGFANDLLLKKKVRIEFDEQYRDSSYLLAYVFLEDGTFVNTEILRYGYANLRIMPPNTKYEKELRSAYGEARKEKRGLQGE